MGAVDHRADDRRAPRPPSADAAPVQVHAGAAEAPARDQEAAGQVQGRQAAPESGDDEVLPGEQGQSPGLLPSADRADAGLHLALLHAAEGPQARHLPGHRRLCGRGAQVGQQPVLQPVQRGDRRGGPRRLELRVHPRPYGQGHRSRAGHADPALRGLAAGVQPAHDGERRQEPAPDDDRPAAGLRRLHHQLPGGPARLLDHDEPVDDPPAVHRAPNRRADPPAGGGGGGAGRSEGGGARDEFLGGRKTGSQARGPKPKAKSEDGKPKRETAPPPPPRRKKKARSGRRR